MRTRRLAACVVVAVAAALAARSCATDTPTADDAPAPTASDTEAARPAVERRRAHVQPPEQAAVVRTTPTTVEAPTAPLVDGEVEEEHRGVGDETLELFVVDAATDTLVESRVRLWRLGVPADARWPEGDHIQEDLRVAGSHVLRNLPPGRYRLEVGAAAPGTEDPPEFVVREGQENTFRARIELPSEDSMGIRVFDEHGVPLSSATRQLAGTGTHWKGHADAPAWARPRSLRDPESTRFGGRFGGRRNLSTGRTYEPVEAEHGVFDLGVIRRSGKGFGWSRGYSFRFPDRTDVRVRARSRDADDGRTYVAITVPPQPLIESVRLPDGTNAADAGADIEIACDALSALPGDHGLWRTVPIHVTAELAGYEKLDFTWCIDDGTPVRRTLSPSPTVDR